MTLVPNVPSLQLTLLTGTIYKLLQDYKRLKNCYFSGFKMTTHQPQPLFHIFLSKWHQIANQVEPKKWRCGQISAMFFTCLSVSPLRNIYSATTVIKHHCLDSWIIQFRSPRLLRSLSRENNKNDHIVNHKMLQITQQIPDKHE